MNTKNKLHASIQQEVRNRNTLNEERKDLSILLVENSEEWIAIAEQVVRQYLKHIVFNSTYTGYIIHSTANPHHATEILFMENIDVTISDINLTKRMDNIDGLEIFIPDARKIYSGPLIAWSEDKKYDFKARKAGADEFIIKDRHNYIDFVKTFDLFLNPRSYHNRNRKWESK